MEGKLTSNINGLIGVVGSKYVLTIKCIRRCDVTPQNF
jgi:hypothetical protein